MSGLFGLLSATAGFVKVRYLVDKAVIDNVAFRMHYRVTSAILFVCCILCTANSLIGNPIDCIAEGKYKDRIAVINTYCWITSTFTLPHQQNKPVGTHVIASGVGTYVPEEHNTIYHSYYQWVPFVLFLQGILFYLPHLIWKNIEDGKIRKISDKLRGSTMECKESREPDRNKLTQYLTESLHMHNAYAFCYFICEILNFVNVVGNMFFIDKFLGHVFLNYGTTVLQNAGLEQENRTDPMIAIFPRVTKCVFHDYGPSGTIQPHDALCILPLNILNEKIFIFLWFWFIFLAVVSGLTLVYSIVLTVYPPMRNTVLEKRFKFKTPGGVSTLVSQIQVGDFFLLHLLGQNMCTMSFKELLEDFMNKLDGYKNTLKLQPSNYEMSPMYPKLPKDPDA